ncbi:MAG TPA: alpha/beta hydrolase [Candidatus Corynebacterium avicola]|uniref:Alpha/beta hydrolase n=1 Tax=Candidatus Corynebacterium avicola TaxID=2838527 RepID=A0A9D1RQW5_9CORY|nr:alpha/beta hydrolase [Candidatus Corynebacterium avicola]
MTHLTPRSSSRPCTPTTFGLSTAAVLLASAVLAPVSQAEPEAHSSPAPVTWGPCPAGALADEAAECADIEVPEDYSDPDAGTISLTMSRIAATGERKGVIAGNPGGPGGDALQMFSSKEIGNPGEKGRASMPADVREHYDLIGVEPRGLAFGTPLDCATDDPLAPASDIRASCEESDPGYADTITTENTARDLEEARKALGEEKLNLYGVSYGGPMMATYASLFPETTDRVVLDSAASPEQRWFALGSERKDARIEGVNAMFSWIASRDDEYHLGDTPLKVFRSFEEKISGPTGTRLPVTPPGAEGEDLPAGTGSAGELGVRLLDSVTFADWRGGTFLDSLRTWVDPAASEGMAVGTETMLGAIYDQTTWPELAASVRDGTFGDEASTGTELTEEEQEGIELQTATGGYVERAIICNENGTPGDPSRIGPYLERTYTGGDLIRANEDMIASGQFCSGWPAQTSPTELSGAELDREPLNIGYTKDTAVTADGAPEMQQAMGGELELYPGYSHGVMLLQPELAADKVSAYFAD